MSKKEDILKPIVSDTLNNNQRQTIKSEAMRIAEAQLKAQLMLKRSIEYNASILTLVAQVSNSSANGKALKEGRLMESIKKINNDFTTNIEEIVRG